MLSTGSSNRRLAEHLRRLAELRELQKSAECQCIGTVPADRTRPGTGMRVFALN